MVLSGLGVALAARFPVHAGAAKLQSAGFAYALQLANTALVLHFARSLKEDVRV